MMENYCNTWILVVSQAPGFDGLKNNKVVKKICNFKSVVNDEYICNFIVYFSCAMIFSYLTYLTFLISKRSTTRNFSSVAKHRSIFIIASFKLTF